MAFDSSVLLLYLALSDIFSSGRALPIKARGGCERFIFDDSVLCQK